VEVDAGVVDGAALEGEGEGEGVDEADVEGVGAAVVDGGVV
jgi:hypothetical protein